MKIPKKGLYLDAHNRLYKVTRIYKDSETLKAVDMNTGEIFNHLSFIYFTKGLKTEFVGRDKVIAELIYGR